jgi:NAD(P)-dependent dehydrogenase (short-subunit alcohol dehydrogenase family)
MSPITFSFSDHAFVVVGAASGIGNAVARNLSEAGASVILADINAESGTRCGSKRRS